MNFQHGVQQGGGQAQAVQAGQDTGFLQLRLRVGHVPHVDDQILRSRRATRWGRGGRTGHRTPGWKPPDTTAGPCCGVPPRTGRSPAPGPGPWGLRRLTPHRVLLYSCTLTGKLRLALPLNLEEPFLPDFKWCTGRDPTRYWENAQRERGRMPCNSAPGNRGTDRLRCATFAPRSSRRLKLRKR